jgi:hypothetical protein
MLPLQLRAADRAAPDTMDALRRQFGAALGERAQPLDDAIGALDFETALDLCNQPIDAPLAGPGEGAVSPAPSGASA